MRHLRPTASEKIDRPLIVWDGDCGFCRWSVRLLRRLAGDVFDAVPYQQVRSRFPPLTGRDFAQRVYLLEPDGRAYQGAAAFFWTLAESEHRLLHLGRWLYERVGWFARLSEWMYRWVSRHRSQLSRVVRPLLQDRA